MKEFRDFLYVAGIMIIFGSFFLLIGHDSAGGPYWSLWVVHRNLLIWLGLTCIIVLLMWLLGHFTRDKK